MKNTPRPKNALFLSGSEKMPVNNHLERLIKTCNRSEDQKLKEIGKTLTRLLDGTIMNNNTRKPFKVVDLNMIEL